MSAARMLERCCHGENGFPERRQSRRRLRLQKFVRPTSGVNAAVARRMGRKTVHVLVIVSLSAWRGVVLAADVQETGASPPRPKICVVAPDVQVGQGVNAESDLAGAVAESLVSYLSGPVADVVLLKSRVVVQINAEATQQGCTHVVDTSVTHRQGSALKKKLLAVAPGLASAIPMLGGAASSMAAAVAADGLAAMQYDEDLDDDWMDDMRGLSQVSIKKGDVITLKFDLRRPTDTEPMATSQLETRAAANGEDILSPLLEKTATQVLSVILGTTGEVRSDFETAGGEEKRKTRTHSEGES